jgi:hypothetical protein
MQLVGTFVFMSVAVDKSLDHELITRANFPSRKNYDRFRLQNNMKNRWRLGGAGFTNRAKV